MKTALVACLLLAVLTCPAAAQPVPKELPEAEWPLQKKINAAIDRGVAHLKKTQGADGSWRGQFGSAGQTALALFTLVSSGVGKTDPAADSHPGIAKVNVGGAQGAPAGGMAPRTFHFYWLYSAERVGMLLGLKYIGDHDWYKEGARWLVDNQLGSGAWQNGAQMMGAPEPPLAATCFALLFLKKATLPVVTPPVR